MRSGYDSQNVRSIILLSYGKRRKLYPAKAGGQELRREKHRKEAKCFSRGSCFEGAFGAIDDAGVDGSCGFQHFAE